MRHVIILAVLQCVIFMVKSFSYSDCTLFDSHMGATFGLNELKRNADQPPYIIEDGDLPCTTKVEQNFTYYFNICGALASGVPQSCKDTPAVAQSIASASALQVNKNKPDTTSDDWCYLVGQYTEDKTSISLINSDDPTVGLKLSYTGSSCSGGKKRIFNIMLTCANKLNPSPQHALELAGCEYTVTMPSVYGCPLECPVYQRALCGGAGYCAYDYDQQKPKCFCNKGYSGADCSKTSTSSDASALNYSPALLGLSITLFIVIAVLVGSIFLLYRQITAYKDDVSNYQVLRGGDEDSAMNPMQRGQTVV